jgi:hypothetical protein
LQNLSFKVSKHKYERIETLKMFEN